VDIIRCLISKMSVPSMRLIYPPSYSLGTSGSFPRVEVARAKDTMYFHLMPRLSCTSPPSVCLHDSHVDNVAFTYTFY